ncbi:MAG: GtrA family protein [Euryarchaeota archaeon]|nr:GtrA family protein [Euryarchaeota archaeon]
MGLREDIEEKMKECELVVVYPQSPVYRVAYMLARTVFPAIEENPIAPVFGYRGRIYGFEEDENLTEILVQRDYRNVCRINARVNWNKNRVRDFLAVMKKYDDGRVFFRYVLVGILGIVLNLFFFFLLYIVVGINDIIALFIAIELSILVTFFANNYWVYFNRVYTRSMAWRIGMYHFTMLAGIVINVVTYKILFWIGENYLLADLFGILLSSVWNFYMTNVHVFFAQYQKMEK